MLACLLLLLLLLCLQCGGDFVTTLAAYLRATPRFASLMTMVPCDLFQVRRGRNNQQSLVWFCCRHPSG